MSECIYVLYLYQITNKNRYIMNATELKKELANTKLIMDRLFDCVKNGQMEYYKDYLEISTYYLKLNKVKPTLTIV